MQVLAHLSDVSGSPVLHGTQGTPAPYSCTPPSQHGTRRGTPDMGLVQALFVGGKGGCSIGSQELMGPAFNAGRV